MENMLSAPPLGDSVVVLTVTVEFTAAVAFVTSVVASEVVTFVSFDAAEQTSIWIRNRAV